RRVDDPGTAPALARLASASKRQADRSGYWSVSSDSIAERSGVPRRGRNLAGATRNPRVVPMGSGAGAGIQMRCSMAQIRTGNQPVTQITVVEPEPGKQDEAFSLMSERARFMARQPGFVFDQPAQEPRRAAHRQLRAMAKPRSPAGGAQVAGISQG